LVVGSQSAYSSFNRRVVRCQTAEAIPQEADYVEFMRFASNLAAKHQTWHRLCRLAGGRGSAVFESGGLRPLLPIFTTQAHPPPRRGTRRSKSIWMQAIPKRTAAARTLRKRNQYSIPRVAGHMAAALDIISNGCSQYAGSRTPAGTRRSPCAYGIEVGSIRERLRSVRRKACEC